MGLAQQPTLAQPPQDLFSRFAKARVIEVLQTFFTQLPVPHLRFNQDDKLTGIYIKDAYTYNQPNVEMKPQIVVERGGLSFSHAVISQRRGEVPLGDPGRSTDVVVTDLNIQCYSAVGLEANDLADMTCVCLIGFREIIRESIKRLKDLKVFSIGREVLTRSDAAPEEFMVPVGVRVWHDFVFKVIEKELVEFKNILFDLRTSFQEVKC